LNENDVLEISGIGDDFTENSTENSEVAKILNEDDVLEISRIGDDFTENSTENSDVAKILNENDVLGISGIGDDFTENSTEKSDVAKILNEDDVLGITGIGDDFTENSSKNIETVEVEKATEGDYEYTILDDGTAEISKYVGAGGDVVIPSTLGGVSVTSIGDYAFNNDEITSVIIPNSVTIIGEWVFVNCESLTSINVLPNNPNY
jgi:hypothetical protein